MPRRTSSPSGGRFFLDAVGPFRRRDVLLTWTHQKRPSTAGVDRLIGRTWAKATNQARRTGKSIYDGRLCRLIDFSVAGQMLKLKAGPVSFQEFLGTNAAQPRLVRTVGLKVLANPLGVSAVVISGDGFILLGRRSDRVTWHGGMIHPVGGMVELRATGRPPNLFDAVLDELHQELGLAPPRSGIICLGLVRDKSLLQPELIFRVKVRSTVRAIRALARKAVHGDEHEELLAVRDRPSSVAAFLKRRGWETTAVAQAALLLHGLNCWGSGWFADVGDCLRRVV